MDDKEPTWPYACVPDPRNINLWVIRKLDGVILDLPPWRHKADARVMRDALIQAFEWGKEA